MGGSRKTQQPRIRNEEILQTAVKQTGKQNRLFQYVNSKDGNKYANITPFNN